MIDFLKRYWPLFALASGGLILFLVTRGRKGLSPPAIATELRAIRAEAHAEKAAAELGHEKAVEAIEAKHAEAVAKLGDEERAQAELLRKDPKALARFLVQAGSKR